MELNYLTNFKTLIESRKLNVVVLGLGYVGLPLLIQNAKQKYPTIGFDVDKNKIASLLNQEIYIKEHDIQQVRDVIKQENVKFTYNSEDLNSIDLFIICVPTPVDSSHNPDLSYIESASELIARNIKPGNVVVLESTVYPGVTEEVVGRIIEEKTKIKTW